MKIDVLSKKSIIPIKKLEKAVGGLSTPSKMPGFSYGLPALLTCKTGAKLAAVKNTVCSFCYACKGHYQCLKVKNAQMKRLAALSDPKWADNMVELLKRRKVLWFRWHDSGDIISLDHLLEICQIANKLPNVHFWLPTHEHRLVKEYRKMYGEFPSNLVVRLSTPKIDGKPVKTDLCTSSVHRNKPPQGYECPAYKQGNQCGECRACWNKEIKNVSYRYH